MFVTTIEFVVDEGKKELEGMLKAAENVEEFDIADLDKVDKRKNVLISFRNPVAMAFVRDEIVNNIGLKEIEKEMIE